MLSLTEFMGMWVRILRNGKSGWYLSQCRHVSRREGLEGDTCLWDFEEISDNEVIRISLEAFLYQERNVSIIFPHHSFLFSLYLSKLYICLFCPSVYRVNFLIFTLFFIYLISFIFLNFNFNFDFYNYTIIY